MMIDLKNRIPGSLTVFQVLGGRPRTFLPLNAPGGFEGEADEYKQGVKGRDVEWG
jgi:hypothetical protein